MTTDIATLRVYLTEAMTARHQLLTGKRVVSIGEGGNTVSYSRTDLGRLEAYISSLRQQIADLGGEARRRGPLHLSF